MKECPECGSEKIVKNAILKDLGPNVGAEYTLRVCVDQKPDAFIFKQRVHSGVRAEVCGECGYLQPFATEPRDLWTAYQTSLLDVE